MNAVSLSRLHNSQGVIILIPLYWFTGCLRSEMTATPIAEMTNCLYELILSVRSQPGLRIP